MKRTVHWAISAALAGCVWLAAVAQPKTQPPAVSADGCPAPLQEKGTFHTFHWYYPILAESDFQTLRARHRIVFGHSFADELPLVQIAALFSVYGYDYVGSRDGYMLFYRRPVSWVQTTSLPRIKAPNGQLLPELQMPNDLDPEWPSPWVLTHSTPFAGAVALPQSIVAYPCVQ